ncbi:hypothetical protein [Roseateles sp. P5_E4]
MEHWIALAQTILWVTLISGIVIWARKPLHHILTALGQRIEDGSEVAAGPFSIKDLKPQPVGLQAEKAQAELAAPADTANPEPAAGQAKSVLAEVAKQTPAQLDAITSQLQDAQQTIARIASSHARATTFLAVDLALRALQAEFNAPLQRQVTGGRDGGFDGVFEANGQVHIVEVTYFGKSAGVRESAARVLETLRRLKHDAAQYQWGTPQFIFVAVFASGVIPVAHREAIQHVCWEIGQVTPRFYTLASLQHQLGIDPTDWEGKVVN